MPAGELVASLADVGLVAVLQASDEVMRVGEPGGLLNLLGARLLAVQPLGDVGEDRAGEEDGLLADEADLGAQVAHVEAGEVVAAQLDGAGERVVVPLHEGHHCRLAGSRRPDERHEGALRDLEGEASGNLGVWARRVGEVDVAELDGALDAAGLLAGV